jgi:hypothetical protein
LYAREVRTAKVLGDDRPASDHEAAGRPSRLMISIFVIGLMAARDG